MAGDSDDESWQEEDDISPDLENADTEKSSLLGYLRWITSTDTEWIVFVREVLSTVGIVVIIGLVLFGVSGVWPPMVAVASGSMTPHMEANDMIFVTGEHRFTGDGAYADTGVVTYQTGESTGYTTFHEPGNVIVYEPNGNPERTPIIHRVRFWVNDSENWYEEANPDYVGSAENCEELSFCPAPHSGFITKGDANSNYDQVRLLGDDAISSPVKPKWVIGTAQFRIPWLGKIRLILGQIAVTDQTDLVLLSNQSALQTLLSTADPEPSRHS